MLTLAASALFSSALLHAAPVPAPVSGDLYLAFRAEGGTGGSLSYIVKIGQDTVFRSAAADSSFSVTGLGNIGADLAATYGSNWNSRSDLYWGIFGVRPSASSILYASRERSAVAEPAADWPLLDLTGRNTTASQITSVLESIGGYKELDATSNSSVAALQPNSSDASSYNKQVATPGTNDFGSLSEWTSIEGSFATGVSGTALDLFRIAGSGVTRVGTFSLNSSGTLNFKAAGSGTPAAPQITTPPSDATAFSGGIAGFNVVATGTGLTYQWRKGTTPLSDGPNISGSTSDTLTLTNLQTSDSGSYNVVVTNAGGNVTSSDAVLTVSNLPPPPQITSSGTALGVVGTFFTYQILASNSPTSYDATGLPSGLSINTTTGVISGTPSAAGSSSITLAATNTGGTANAPLTLTVNTVPAIGTPPAAQSVKQGQTATFSVTATGSNLTYQWRKDDVDLVDGGNISGATTATLVLLNVTTADIGSYSVVVSNAAGQKTSTPVTLNVEVVIVNSDIRVLQPAGTDLVDGVSVSNFGSELVGKSGKPLVFTIRNNGNANLTGIRVFRAGEHPGDFSVAQPSVSTIAPGGSTTFSVTFKPTQKGTRTAELQIVSNDKDENPFNLSIRGKGVIPEPEIDVEQPVGSPLADEKSRRSFGTAVVNTNGRSRTFTITNSGKADLTDLQVVISGTHRGDFTATQPAKTTLAPGASTTFKVRFKPAAKGERTAELRIRSNDGNESPFQVGLRGLANNG